MAKKKQAKAKKQDVAEQSRPGPGLGSPRGFGKEVEWAKQPEDVAPLNPLRGGKKESDNE